MPAPERIVVLGRRRGFVLGRLASLAITFAAAGAFVAAHDASACAGRAYAYAGVAGTRTAAGIGASVSTLSLPRVFEGHVAAFVGVGGPGQGPAGSDEWLQIGFSGFSGGESSIYYEAALPGRAPLYTELKANVHAGETHRIAVLEQHGRRDWWRVWLDGRPASRPIHLTGSHARWVPMATTESWTPGRSTCNAYAFAFNRLSVPTAPGGSWRRLGDQVSFSDPGYRVVRRAQTAFVARTAPGTHATRQLFSVRR
jgi:hypothetical protein